MTAGCGLVQRWGGPIWVLRDDFGPQSEADVLVEFEPDVRVGYLSFFRLQDELAKRFGREVDLFTPNSLKPFA